MLIDARSGVNAHEEARAGDPALWRAIGGEGHGGPGHRVEQHARQLAVVRPGRNLVPLRFNTLRSSTAGEAPSGQPPTGGYGSPVPDDLATTQGR